MLVIDDNSPDGTGEIADRLAAELRRGRRAPPRRARRGSAPRTSPASGARSPTAPSSCSRWTATSRTTRATSARLIAAADDGRRPRARLPLRPRRLDPELGARAPLHLPRRLRLRAASGSDARCATSPAASSATGGSVLETIDLDAIDSKGYAFQIESDLPDAAQGLPRRRGADHVRRPRGGRLEDVARDRARGDLEGAGAALRGARGPSLAEVVPAAQLETGRRPRPPRSGRSP